MSGVLYTDVLLVLEIDVAQDYSLCRENVFDAKTFDCHLFMNQL